MTNPKEQDPQESTFPDSEPPSQESTFPDSELLGTPSQLATQTILTYETVYKRSLREAIDFRSSAPDDVVAITPADLVDDLIHNRRSLSPSSIALRRCAIMWGLEKDKMPGFDVALKDLKSWRPDRASEVRTSARAREPGRMLPEADLNRLSETLLGMGGAGDWGARTQRMLIASIGTGARPVEWPFAKWIDEEKNILRIFSAKVKKSNAWDRVPPLAFDEDEDGDGETARLYKPRGDNAPSIDEVDFERRLSQIRLTKGEMDTLRASRTGRTITLFRDVAVERGCVLAVDLHMSAVRQVLSERLGAITEETPRDKIENVYREDYYNMVRHTLWRACKKAFPDGRLYSLADARSTFSANRKAAQGLAATSMEMGHAGTTTTRGNYASAAAAWRGYHETAKQRKAEQAQANKDGQAEGANSAPLDLDLGDIAPPGVPSSGGGNVL